MYNNMGSLGRSKSKQLRPAVVRNMSDDCEKDGKFTHRFSKYKVKKMPG